GIARFVGKSKSTSNQAPASVVFPPWRLVRKHETDHGIELPQACPFDDLVAKSSETEADFDVAEETAGNEAEVAVCEAGTVAIAVLEAELDGCADNQNQKIPVQAHCRRNDLREYINRCARRGIGHHRQIDKLVDRTALDPRQDACIGGLGLQLR